jgi:hypothetical protein
MDHEPPRAAAQYYTCDRIKGVWKTADKVGSRALIGVGLFSLALLRKPHLAVQMVAANTEL